MALPSQTELRHQIALLLGVDLLTQEDIDKAAAFIEQRRAVKVVNGDIVDGDRLPIVDLFVEWVQAGGPPVVGSDLVEMILYVVNRDANPEPPNTK